MLPRSLLFSSDEGTARSLGQALRELELDVEHCPEIFAAVEKLTSRSFDVVVVDWDDGVEAVFFLKTARELKTSSNAFVVAIAATGAHQAAMRVGADLVLAKPIVPEQAKRELFNCDEFLRHMKTWLAVQLTEDQSKDEHAARVIAAPPPPPPPSEKSRPAPVAIWPTAPRAAAAPPPKATSMALPSYLPRISSEVQTLFASESQKTAPAKPADAAKTTQRRTNILRRSAFAVAFLTAGYISVEPLRSQAVAHSVANFYDMAVTKAHAILHPSAEDDGSADDDTIAQNIAPQKRPIPRHVDVRTIPSSGASLEDQAALDAQISAAQLDMQPMQPVMQSAVSRIPESLRMPFQNASIRTAAARISPSLLSGLQPVIVPEELSEKLLLEKIQPNYPQQALQAGLEGPVVLQAFIGTDGHIQDLKLVQGYFVLGQAACRAVRQWRYKPYFLNGQAVAAQTYVTIDFKLPASPNGS